MIRLIALDLDGTLLDPAGRITQASKDAIARARAAGVRVVLNTGRPIQEAVWFAGEAGCDALLSCLGGAAVVDGVRGETLRRWDMPEESGRRALELCLGREIELMIFAGEEIVVDPFSKESLPALVGIYPTTMYAVSQCRFSSCRIRIRIRTYIFHLLTLCQMIIHAQCHRTVSYLILQVKSMVAH